MAEALLIEDVQKRTLIERQVSAMRLAQAEEWDTDVLPDVDTATELFGKWLHGATDDAEMTPEDELRVSVGLERKR